MRRYRLPIDKPISAFADASDSVSNQSAPHAPSDPIASAAELLLNQIAISLSLAAPARRLQLASASRTLLAITLRVTLK
jgi:hypothetical protein